MKPKYSIIIPTKNEEEGIAKVLCSIPNELKTRSEVIVTDSSDDLTPIIAKRLGAKVISSGKGKGAAMRAAVRKSRGSILIFLDGDCTDPPQYIPKLLKKLKNADLVLGCRSGKSVGGDDPETRKLFKTYCIIARLLFKPIHFKASDPLAGFRVMRKSDWDRLELKSNGLDIETEMNVNAVKKRFRVDEVLIPHYKRAGGFASSKTIFFPKDWPKLFKPLFDYIKEEKIKLWK